MLAQLALHGTTVADPMKANFDKVETAEGKPLPERARERLKHEQQRLRLATEQRIALEKAQERRLRKLKSELARASASATESAGIPETTDEKVLHLSQLRGIGTAIAAVIAQELLWREFHNGKAVGSSVGLTSSPYDSGNDERDQGVTKRGNARARATLIEAAWMWLRYQPESELARWFNGRAASGRRGRRVGIVAVARKLMVALWRYTEFGVIPEGAELKAA
jgi:transposase